jgi:uncharacterized cupredoxin-like copper-binding protein
MRYHRVAVALAAATALIATACSSGISVRPSAEAETPTGSPTGTPSRPATVDVEMVDIAFKPTSLTVSRGSTVTFRFNNTGLVAHDAFIGDAHAQDHHEQAMLAGEMDHHGEGSEAVTVAAGKSGTLTRTFDTAGTVLIGCHEPGHYEAGMKLDLTVA